MAESTYAQSDEPYRLFHATEDLGRVDNLTLDQPWVFADYAPNDTAQQFRGFFDACTDDERDLPEPGDDFPIEYFDDSLWFIQSRSGDRKSICIPAVRWSDGEISWRWG